MVATATAPEVTNLTTSAVVEIHDLCKVYRLVMGKEIARLDESDALDSSKAKPLPLSGRTVQAKPPP